MFSRNLLKIHLRVAMLFIVFSGIAAASSAQEVQQAAGPAGQPVLRIETGMHTAAIGRIGIDRENRYLVTSSDDKTVRVWELPSGRLLRVLRPPIGPGHEGRMYGVAISPDGRTVVAGGYTSPDGLNTSIYIFDRESGRLIKRITGLPNVNNHLVYSPDGRRLAASLWAGGVRVFETRGYSQIFADSEYGDQSYGADFDSSGGLVTASYDGFLRLYRRTPDGRSLRLAARQKVEGGSRPYAVSFSPDGSRIAVCFDDSPRVVVVSGRDLSPVYVPENDAADDTNCFSVAWSVDGQTLFAGGRYYKDGRQIIRCWADGGRGRWHDVGAAGNTILHILPTRDGGAVYGAFDPAFGRIDARGNLTLFVNAAIADYRVMLENFLCSSDGTRFRFAYEQFAGSPMVFSLGERQLKTAAGAEGDLRPPSVSGIAVTDWQNSTVPKLNGQALPLSKYEVSRSLAVAPDGSRFLIGADWYLRLFDSTGKLLWQKANPGITWGVNISADGRLAMAASGDGTIRWYRMTDGVELLAFFPHNDRKRWILWTPSGYYDCSPGAEELIGWHFNNGQEASADFFPVAQFRNALYRPDVIARVLRTGDETMALDLANLEAGRRKQQAVIATQLPPVVEIISPSDDSGVSTNTVTLKFIVRTPSGEPVTSVRVLVEGRPISARGLVTNMTAGDVREVQVAVPDRDSTVSVIAENRYSASVPASIRLRWTASRPAPAQPGAVSADVAFKPRLYILAVGVSRYANEKFNLRFADKDARDFVAAMLAQKGLLYRDVVVYSGEALTNEKATKEEVLDGLDWIRRETTSNDVAMVFFAGHGVNDQNNYYYYCPYNLDPERLLRTGVACSDIRNTVSAIAGKALFFIDTCHSGNSLGMGGRRGGFDINIVINELSSAQNGVIVFSASTSSESSNEGEEWNNGAFTKALVEGINGRADIFKKGRITYGMLNVYVAERVKDLTRGQQHPTMNSPSTVPDFPIAIRK